MLFDRPNMKVFVYKETIDMRSGFERLHEYCVHHMGARINEGHAYLFFGKNRSRMKILIYDGTGLVLISKKIERRSFMLHADLLGRSEISISDLRLIFHGGVISNPVFGEEADRLDLKAVAESPLIEKILSTQREALALPLGFMNYRDNHDGKSRQNQTTHRQ